MGIALRRKKKKKRSPLDRLYPIGSPGLPAPGPSFVAMAEALASISLEEKGRELLGGKTKRKLKADELAVLCKRHLNKDILWLYRQCLGSDGSFTMPIKAARNRVKALRVVGGHVWSSPKVGPVKADVMVIGKMLGEEERNVGRNLVGPTGELLRDTCERCGIEDYDTWYVTNLIKTEHPDSAEKSTLSSTLVADWLPLLHEELRLVRPKYILCLGADAIKALLGKKATLKSIDGRVVEYSYPVSREPDENGEVEMHTVLVMGAVHPAFVLRQPENQDQLDQAVGRFGQLTRGVRWDQAEDDIDHRVIDSIEELKALYYEIKETCEENLIAIDAEWHGDHPENHHAYLRTIQLSWAYKKAACISLRHPGGKKRFQGKLSACARWINKIIAGRQLAGHFLVADAEWLKPFGIKIVEAMDVPDTWQAYMKNMRANRIGGFDTGYACHAINETADFSLKSMALRFTSAPRYDVKLTEWAARYCAKHKLKAEELEGYGECPDEILEAYGNYDADVTWRIAVELKRRLDCDAFGHNCWEPYWINMRAWPAILEMNTSGMRVDKKRVDELTDMYMKVRDSLRNKIRTDANWLPDPQVKKSGLNLESVFHVREYLFGSQFNGKINKADPDKVVRIRPKGAKSLRLTPTLTTDKRPMRWADVLDRGLENDKTPSTKSNALALLAEESLANETVLRRIKNDDGTVHDVKPTEAVNDIRNYRFISQILKNVLRTPKLDKITKEFETDEDGYVYEKGFASSMCDDGRVRTHIYPTKETGRWSSARPPMQNFAKRREKDYKKIAGPLYKYPLRSIVQADPGTVLIEADYVGAELFAMAALSGDPLLLEHARRNSLSEWDSEFYDIHSNVAVLAFGLKCEPTKAGLESIGMAHMRTVAKAVVFGVAYGRQAKAIQLAAREEKVKITVEQAQQTIDTLFAMYPRLKPFFEECQARALEERWICGTFGRFRRVPVATQRDTQGDFERQFMNFPIQGLIADVVGRAVDHLYHFREKPEAKGVEYTMKLQIHDAVILQAPYKHAEFIINKVLPTCMVKGVPIFPCRLNGTPTGKGPYHLAIDTGICTHWGEQMYPEECLKLGIDPVLANWSPYKKGGYIHPELKENHRWYKGAWHPLAS